MDLQKLYLTTDGRIGRQTWWIGGIILAVINLVISMLLLPIIGLGGPNMAALMQAQADPQAIAAMAASAVQTSAWASLVLFLIFAYPAYCLSLKRRHDKNSDGKDVLAYFALTLLLLLVQAFGLGYTMTDVGGVMLPMPSTLFSGLGLITGVFGIYLLVVLGFLKGTDGDNSYGPDPLRS